MQIDSIATQGNVLMADQTTPNEEAGPEHRAKNTLTEWLISHGATVWWEESNPWGHDLFTIRREADVGGMPDLVVEINDYAFVVEFKTGASVGQIYDSLIQLQGYWVEHVAGEQQFICGDSVVEPDGFLTASKHSRQGRLFPAYAEVLQGHDDMDDSRQSCYDYGQLPPREYRMTEQHIRTLWRLVKKAERSIQNSGQTPHAGALLSSQLERERIDPHPAVLWNRGKTNQDWVVFR